MRDTTVPSDRVRCHVRLQDDGNAGMRVTVYDDDGFGFPGTQRGYVEYRMPHFPQHSLARVDISSLGLVYSDGAEFHIAYPNSASMATQSPFLDDGSNVLSAPGNSTEFMAACLLTGA